jgi:hypothetical protein
MSTIHVLDQARGALHAAERAQHELEHCAPAIIQLALIRYVVIECRRSTFVLQKLSSRVEGFNEVNAMRRSIQEILDQADRLAAEREEYEPSPRATR